MDGNNECLITDSAGFRKHSGAGDVPGNGGEGEESGNVRIEKKWGTHF